MLPGPVTPHKKSLTGYCLSAARTVIPRHWRSAITPSIAEWYTEMGSIMRMEELLCFAQGRQDSFVRTWSTWVTFMATMPQI
ncbi:hypothetical protein XELAEV_18025155mg [Xenopus laevis]|uniref:Uncharacterized protein n=1 Tax=Xenopus laevis TaxID=8355 RepID=A0A974D1E6_XENLA|nr:hypothetical protein XELAEV_18025155mg [Xenopus laevis]